MTTCCDLWPFCDCLLDDINDEVDDQAEGDLDALDDRPLYIRSSPYEVTPSEFYNWHYDPEPRG